MLVDMTLKITPRMVKDAQGNEKKALVGHLGTHFDVMNKEFPLEYAERKGCIFDVCNIRDRDIDVSDIDLSLVESGMFVAFYTGFIEREEYGTKPYFTEHPQFSKELIKALIGKGVSIIGIDCAGVRRGKEHTPTDQYCADHGIFIVENLYNLGALLKLKGDFTVFTFPMNYAEMSGLPCRVIAKSNEA